MYTLILYSLISAALYYLGSRAVITNWLWSRYPPKLASFMDCSACTGFWYGFVVAAVLGRKYDLTYMGLDGLDPMTPFIVGLCSIVLTPITSGTMHWGLYQLGVIAPEDPDDQNPGNQS